MKDAPLDMTPEAFRTAGHRLVDRIAELLGELRERPVCRATSPREITELFPDRLPHEGSDPASLLDEAARVLFEHSLFNGHPRFFGYITGSPAPIGALADMLAATVNPNCGAWELSPVAAEIERQCVRWIGDLIGYPAAGGLLVSGGNMANFAGFLAARRAKGGEGLRARGLGSTEGRLLAYASAATHTWIQKAADLFGLGTDSVRFIPTDPSERIDLDALRRQLAADIGRGDRPFLLVGTAGGVATGAIDALDRLAAIAREHDLWFHIDGAYGAFAAAVPELRDEFRGQELADSLACDPHKWLYTPLEAGCILTRDPDVLPAAFRYKPTYYHFEAHGEPRPNFHEYGLQNSRGFRALKVWLVLRQAGRQGYEAMIGENVRLARALYDAAGQHPEIEAVTCGLSIATFRYVPEGASRDLAYLNRLNEALLERIKASGEVFVSNAVVDGKFVLRACICNFRTTLADVRAVPEIVARLGRTVERET